MGVVLSTLLESVFGGGDTIERGLQKGYFPLGKNWEMDDVEQCQKLLQELEDEEQGSTAAVIIQSISLVGQKFAAFDVLAALLQVFVARPELKELRIALADPNDAATVYTVVGQHRPVQSPKLHLELFLDASEVKAYWRQLAELPSHNKFLRVKP